MVRHAQLALVLSLIAPSVVIAASPSANVPQLARRDPPTCVTATNPSPSPFLICNREGTARNPSLIKQAKAKTQEACRDSCLQDTAQCVSFSYGPGRQCLTYNKRIVKQSFKKGDTGRTFWNRRCYIVTCTCPEGQDLCTGDCVDTTSDSSNCGSCGNVCGDGATCTGSACTCPTGQALCSGPNEPCQDTDSDPDNCGACGNKCGDGATCSSGVCTCPTGQGLCNGPNGPCSDVLSDNNNCGACGSVCSTSLGCYKGICADCSGDFCAQGAGTPCGTQSSCNCVGIEGSTTYGRCSDVNDGTSCEAFQPRCSTTADCPSGSYCFNYQIACNCARNACIPISSRCSNPSAPSRIFRASANAGGLKAKNS